MSEDSTEYNLPAEVNEAGGQSEDKDFELALYHSFRTEMEEGRRAKPGAIQNTMFNHRGSIQVQSFLLIRSHTHVSLNHL
jgi:hypothetical protein